MKKNGKPVAFDLNALKAEEGITVTPRSEESSDMYKKLDELAIGQSYRMPIDLMRIYTNARTAHKRITKKVFIFRKLDKYNFRTWRLADDVVLMTRRRDSKTKKQLK